MPLPRALGRFNGRVTNPILWPIVSRLPGFGRIVHVGRVTGTVYRTPILAFEQRDRLVFALTYGPDAQWVQNVIAAGACDYETQRSTRRLVEPRRIHDPERRSVPRLVGLVLGIIGADDFLEMRVDQPSDRESE